MYDVRFLNVWIEMHVQLERQLEDQATRRVPPFKGWAPDWEEQRAASVARLSPEEQEKIRRYDAELEEKRRRRGPFQIARWN
jgi:hypothetical protein